MAWLTTEDGRKVNTEWFDSDERKKYQQIEKAQEEAKKASAAEKSKPKENAYGFEVSSGIVEFSDAHWKEMAKLRKKGKFADSDLSRRVDDKLYELGEAAGDDILTMYDKIQDDVTDDEYWAGYHAIANWLKLSGKKGK